MSQEILQQKLTEIAQSSGIKDLPSAAARLYFAKALVAELEGNPAEAERCLLKAVEAEEKALALRNPK